MILALSEALEFISSWVPSKSPDTQVLYPRLNAGLNYEEIQQKVINLPFDLSTEVYELYQWSDGGFLGNLPYPGHDYKGDYEKIINFLSLEEAVTIAKQWGNGSFPLFEDEDGFICFTVGSKEKQRNAPIFCSDESPYPNQPRFESLTIMMLELVKAMKYKLGFIE